MLLILTGVTLIAFAVGIGVCTFRDRGHEFLVTAPGSNTIIFASVVKPHDVFDLSYLHSVSNSRVTGRFRITGDGGLEPVTTTFLSFGPGLPWSSGERLERLEDGSMVVHHDEPPRDRLRIWVSPLTEDTITLKEQVVRLTTGASDPFLIEISIRRR